MRVDCRHPEIHFPCWRLKMGVGSLFMSCFPPRIRGRNFKIPLLIWYSRTLSLGKDCDSRPSDWEEGYIATTTTLARLFMVHQVPVRRKTYL